MYIRRIKPIYFLSERYFWNLRILTLNFEKTSLLCSQFKLFDSFKKKYKILILLFRNRYKTHIKVFIATYCWQNVSKHTHNLIVCTKHTLKWNRRKKYAHWYWETLICTFVSIQMIAVCMLPSASWCVCVYASKQVSRSFHYQPHDCIIPHILRI